MIEDSVSFLTTFYVMIRSLRLSIRIRLKGRKRSIIRIIQWERGLKRIIKGKRIRNIESQKHNSLQTTSEFSQKVKDQLHQMKKVTKMNMMMRMKMSMIMSKIQN